MFFQELGCVLCIAHGNPFFYDATEPVDQCSLLTMFDDYRGDPVYTLKRPRKRSPANSVPFKFRVGYPVFYELEGVLYMGVSGTPNSFSVVTMCQDVPIGIAVAAGLDPETVYDTIENGFPMGFVREIVRLHPDLLDTYKMRYSVHEKSKIVETLSC